MKEGEKRKDEDGEREYKVKRVATEDFCLCAFCATPPTHTHTQVETRDNHPLPDSPPSISSHGRGGGTKKRRKKTKEKQKKQQAAEPLSLPVLVALAPMLSSTTLSPVYKALTQFFFLFFFFLFSPVYAFFFLPGLFVLFPHQLTNRPGLIYFPLIG